MGPGHFMMAHIGKEISQQEVFEAALEPILEVVYRSARNMTQNEEDAQDLVQEAALRAFRSFHTFQEGTHFKAWFLRILTHVFYEKFRKQQREVETVTLEGVEDLYLYRQTLTTGLHSSPEDPAAAFMEKITATEITTAIQDLPEEFRVVCSLYLVEELSYGEIADILECPVGTVRSRLHRGRKMLQKALWHVAQEYGLVGPRKTTPGKGG